MIPYWLSNFLHDTLEVPNHVYTEPLYRSLRLHDQSTTFIPQGIFDTSSQRTISTMITWVILVDLDVQPSRWLIRINTVNFFFPRSTWHLSLVSPHKWLLGTAITIVQVVMKDVTTLSGKSSVPYSTSYEWDYLGQCPLSLVIPKLWTLHNSLKHMDMTWDFINHICTNIEIMK